MSENSTETRPPLVECPHCGSMVPSGEFCGHCGAHLTRASADRPHSFAAVPSEPVLHLSIVSTLFPHLPHRRGGAFRWALLTGVVVVALLAAVHLFAPATIAALLVLPVLYLLYIYEAEVYESEPWLLIAATMVTGAVLGYVFTTITGGTVQGFQISEDNGNNVLFAGVALPIIAQALMLVGPMLLFVIRGNLREPLDGLTFGAASALGFTFATKLTAFWPLLNGPLVGSGSTVDWGLRLLNAGILVMLINASTTSIVTAAIWLQRYDRRVTGRGWEASVLATLAVAVGAQVILGILAVIVPDLVLQVGIRFVATVALLMYVRLVIHRALLAEGAAHEIGPDSACPECHRIVPTMAFCPSCGVARSASKQTRMHSAAPT
ncbi:MAG TPA: PrsW family glutamic-type intramembrane protease [Candidatus Dormibacteraeota bacterium]|nr:PrsW family glutamic-type intramembrane protease [Candidatus Dormibacteraeota bacterium]